MRLNQTVSMHRRDQRYNVFDEYLMACVNLYRAIDITTFLSIVNGQTGMNAKRPELESWLKDREAVRGQPDVLF